MPTTTKRVSKTPGICGGNACIRGTRITVWGLAQWRKLGLSDAQIRQRVAGVSLADLAAAWEYVAAHPEEIEEAIRQNAEA